MIGVQDLRRIQRGRPHVSKTLRDHAQKVAHKLTPHLHSAREKAAPVLADAREKAGPMIAEARDKAAPYVAEAREKAAPYLAEARDKAGPALAEARDKAAPYVAEARERASDRFHQDVLPALAAAVAAADEATAEHRAEAGRRGRAAAAALKGEVDAPAKKHRLRKIMTVLGLAGIAAAVTKALSDRQSTATWQSAYTPTAPTPAAPASPVTPAAPAAGADDTGAASPDEAIADAEETPHGATTPENPVEVVEVDE